MPPKKNKKKNFDEDYFFGEENEGEVTAQVNGEQSANNDDSKPSEDDESESKGASKKAAKASKKKNKFEGFDDYFFEDDTGEVNENEQPQDDSNVSSKKRDEPAAEPKEAETIDFEEELETKSKKGKKKNKKKGDLDDEEEHAGPSVTESKESSKSEAVKPTGKPPPPPAGRDSDDEGGKKEGGGGKSAADKKAEKKKRDAEKRRLERQKEEERLQRLAEQQAKEEEKQKAKKKATEESGDQPEGADEAADQGGDEAAEAGSKGGKDKKGGKKEKGGAKGGLGAAARKALQEELDRKKAEEERLRKEEEEKERIAEEMRREQEEKERLEKEKKEKKKQKKKEEIAKQKADGTYMTKVQKEEKARMELAKQMFLQSGNVKILANAAATPATATPTIPDAKENTNNNQSNNKQNQFSGPKRKQSNWKEKEKEKENKDQVIEEQKAGDTAEKVEEKEKIPEVLDNWEDQSEDEDWEKMDEEEDGDEDSKGKGDKDDKGVGKVEALTNGVKSMKLENGGTAASKVEVDKDDEDSGGSDDESSSDDEVGTYTKEEIRARIDKRRKEAEANKDVSDPRCAVVCVLGHVDTGKTKILDKIRRTNVQDGEAGGITQQIGATNMPQFAITEWSKSANVKGFDEAALKLPGFLVIDTPGHESFTNLRTRGSSLCDLAILVVDIMHGLEPQTLESIELLKKRQAPFVVALNKIDRLFEWKSNPAQDIRDTIKKQKKHTKDEFETRLKKTIAEFAEKCELNVVPFWENEDPATYVSICPTSAHTGDGMGNMIWYMVHFCQSYLKKRLAYRTEPQATVLEVKEIQGLGTTIDVIVVNGRLKEGKPIVVAGYDGPIQTYIKALLVPPAMKELRIKAQYDKVKQVRAATGVKILAKDVEKALAGMPMLVASRSDEQEVLTEEMKKILQGMISSIKLNDRGVYVQASTLGSLEALLEFLKQSQIPYSGINIGPVHKKDVMRANTMLEHNELYGVILAFDVKVERDAQDMADTSGIRIFTADIIYHLFDKFMAFKEELKQKAKDKHKHLAMFPCKLRVLPNCIFNTRDPIIIGVTVEAGIVKPGTQICVPSKEGIILGTVATLEQNNRPVDFARQGADVCLKIENTTGEAPKLYGRHFDSTDILMSKLTRESIDALKDHFRDEMTKNDWLLVKELKAVFRIV